MPTKKLRQEYGDKVKFVLAYVVDPHPLAPDLSPYSGAVWQLSYSKYRQPTTFAERLKNAPQVLAAIGPGPDDGEKRRVDPGDQGEGDGLRYAPRCPGHEQCRQ